MNFFKKNLKDAIFLTFDDVLSVIIKLQKIFSSKKYKGNIFIPALDYKKKISYVHKTHFLLARFGPEKLNAIKIWLS